MPERIMEFAFVPGDDRLRRCRYRICCGAQVCLETLRVTKSVRQHALPKRIFAQPHPYRMGMAIHRRRCGA